MNSTDADMCDNKTEDQSQHEILWQKRQSAAALTFTPHSVYSDGRRTLAVFNTRTSILLRLDKNGTANNFLTQAQICLVTDEWGV